MAFKITTTPPAIPLDTPIQKLVRSLKKTYEESKWIFHCQHPNHNNMARYQVIWNERMESLTVEYYKALEKEGKAGHLKAFITLDRRDGQEATEVAAIFMHFYEQLQLDYASDHSDYHSHFCELTERDITLTVSWKPETFPQTKPPLVLEEAKPWSHERLNEDRKTGTRTDCTLFFGAHVFPAHELIIGTFRGFLEIMFASGMRETAEKKYTCPMQQLNFSREELDSFMTFIYTQKLDLDPFPLNTAIKFLEWSFFLQSESLRNTALTHIHKKSDDLTPSDTISLLFLQSEYSLPNMSDFCDWILKDKPKFYEGHLSAEDLLKSFVVARRFHLPEFEDELKKVWDAMPLSEKTKFVNAALTNNNPPLLKAMRKLSERACNPKRMANEDEKEKSDFIQAFEELSKRVFTITVTSPNPKNLINNN